MRSARRSAPAAGSRPPAPPASRPARSARACASSVIVRCLANDRAVPAGELAGVQRDREDLRVADADLDAPADQAGIERVVAGVKAQIRVGRDPESPSAGRRRAARPAAAPSPRARRASRSTGRARSVLCVRALTRSRTRRRAGPGSRARSRTRRPGSKLRLRVALQPLDGALGLRIGRLAEPPVDPQLAAEGGELLRRPAAMAVRCRPGGPRPASAAAPPSDHRQRAIPASRSGVCLEKTSAPAPARE